MSATYKPPEAFWRTHFWLAERSHLTWYHGKMFENVHTDAFKEAMINGGADDSDMQNNFLVESAKHWVVLLEDVLC